MVVKYVSYSVREQHLENLQFFGDELAGDELSHFWRRIGWRRIGGDELSCFVTDIYDFSDFIFN